MPLVYIANIPTKRLLTELWHAAKRAYWLPSEIEPKFNINVAMKEIITYDECPDDGCADYICGKIIKVHLFRKYVETEQYDKWNGQGTFEKVLDKINSGLFI